MQKSKLQIKIQNFKFLIVVLNFAFLILNFSGCVTAPTRESFPTYTISGATYYPLLALCEARKIGWDYDTFSRTMTLTKAGHRINLMVGESLVLVDGNSMHLRHPVDFYQGTVVVPCGFKEQILDTLFREAPGAKQALRIKKAVIDAGHGGTDPGAIGRAGLREKGVNLDIAKRVANILRNDGIEVVMTRPSDRFVLLNSRVEMANNSGADIFVSIHSNANRVRSLSGFEVYYVSPSVSDSQRALSAARYAPLNLDTAGLAGNSLDLKAILWDMVYTSNRAESIELARSISKAMNDNLEARLLGIKGARFEVLKGVRMPAVLVEVGFLSNAQEERLLKNNFYRQRIAESIAQGIRDYGCSALLAKADN